MDEREMLEKIADSAQDLTVPKYLQPDQVRRQLKGRPYKTGKYYRMIAAAACLCLCFGIGLFVSQNDVRKMSGSLVQDGESSNAQEQKDRISAAKKQDTNLSILENDEAGAETGEDSEAVSMQQKVSVKKLGKMYTLASDYGAVYDAVKEASAWQMKQEKEAMTDGAARDGADYANNIHYDENVQSPLRSDLQKEGSNSSQSADKEDFSTTNLQVDGIDESDVVKTDGNFIYAAQENQIQTLDVSSAVPYAAGTIRPDMDEDTDRICEMYVADKLLTIIVQTEKTSLQQKEEEQKAADVRYIDTKPVTKIITYDLSDPKNPVLKDTAVQDGWYQTSRKVGGRLYLFTNQSMGITDDMLREDAVSDDRLKQWLPSVNGSVVPSDCIYLQKGGSYGLLMAAIDLTDHSRILDTKLLIHQYTNLYVSSTSVYLYLNDYVNEASRTRIARFALEADGTIRAVAAKTVKGNITDTFAIHEKGGYLLVLTSVTSADPWENRVYVLDENMQTAGKLTGLAKGEQIYAARFAGDIGYFVTYRNTDPLFSVDFSDPKNPQIIGELKVTGFSEYLHFWSDDKLLGIGYETDPDSGETVGVKLSMFDISDPLKVKEEAKLVLQGVDDCEGMYDYKSVLVSEKKNLIAFTTKTYAEKYLEDYRVFSYKDGKFISRIERTLANGTCADRKYWRSVYVGDMLYLVSEKKMIAFAMNDDWKEIGKLVYGWIEQGKIQPAFAECE